jgi:hypothetical protein
VLHTGSWDKIEPTFPNVPVAPSPFQPAHALCGNGRLEYTLIWWVARRQVAEGLPDFRIFYTAGVMLRRGQGLSKPQHANPN